MLTWWMIGLVFADGGLGSGPALLAGMLAAGAVFLVVLGMQRVVAGRPSSMNQRLIDFVNAGPAAPDAATAAAAAEKHKKKARRASARSTSTSAFSLKIARELAQADIKISTLALLRKDIETEREVSCRKTSPCPLRLLGIG
jgi:hypothetical protein